VDFESPSAAEAAVKALQLQGIQAQMAKVIFKVLTPFLFIFSLHSFFFYLHTNKQKMQKKTNCIFSYLFLSNVVRWNET
jgi:hypothetical protein